MAVDHPAYRAAGVFTEPFVHNATIGEGLAVVLGPKGDRDPGFVLSDLVLYNTGAKDLYVAPTLTEAVSGEARYPMATGSAIPLELAADIDQLVLFNANGSAGSTTAKLSASRTARRNSGREAGHPGNGEFVIRATPVANNTVVYSVTPRKPITLSAFKTWSKVVPSGAACTAALASGGKNLLSVATIDLTALTTVTLQSHTLTATVADRNIDAGVPITLTIVGGAGLTPGDLLAALTHSLR